MKLPINVFKSFLISDLGSQVELELSEALGEFVFEQQRPFSRHTEDNLSGNRRGLTKEVKISGREGQVDWILDIELHSGLFFTSVFGSEKSASVSDLARN